jgi:Phospholipase_D-nuclease N-terminal
VNAAVLARQLAERRIRRACRRLPDDVREECYREWVAELPAILGDPGSGRGFFRALRALSYSAGIARATRRLRRVSGGRGVHARHAPAVPWRDGAPPAIPRGPAFRATVGVGIWLIFVVAFVALVRLLQANSFWLILPGFLAAAGFVAFCLADLARAAEVRYLPKWGWALVCLLSVPLGGIMYLSVGRYPRAQSAARGEPGAAPTGVPGE